jgi:hypothetical protein
LVYFAAPPRLLFYVIIKFINTIIILIIVFHLINYFFLGFSLIQQFLNVDLAASISFRLKHRFICIKYEFCFVFW